MITNTKTKRLKLFSFKSSDVNKCILIKLAKDGKDKPKYSTDLGKVLSSYINKCSKTYDDTFTKSIKKLRPDWFVSLTFKNKQNLIKIAKDNLDKPKTTCSLGLALNNYTRKSSKTYDPIFFNKIKRLRPDWFIDYTAKNKQILINMAKEGKDKPNWKSKLGIAFRNYSRPKSGSFDKVFCDNIKKISPKWFINSVDDNKQSLLKIAKDKKLKKPLPNTKLGRALRRYQYNPHSRDLNFINKIKKLRPSWFLVKLNVSGKKYGTKYSCFKNKECLLKIAKRDKNKPSQNTKLGCALRSYISKNSDIYDPFFAKKIKKIAPSWLLSRSDIRNNNKSLILNIAKKGNKRPSYESKLGSAFAMYICKSHKSYDKSFFEAIKKLRPDWFNRPASLTKKEILTVAESEKRPHHKSRLGMALHSYITKSNRVYDEKFTIKIKRLRPDWFRTPTSLTKKDLLTLARKGLKRPNHRSKLGMALCSYTGKSHGSYDKVFDKTIKKLRPDWFRKK